MNEKFAPELLESKADLVECMLDQIKEMASLEFQCNLHSTHNHPFHPLILLKVTRAIPYLTLPYQ